MIQERVWSKEVGKIMALDVGEKTIGVAFCEEGTRLAFPGKTIWRQEGKKRDMAALRQLVADNDVCRIVVGIPLMPDGSHGPQAETVKAFITTLQNNVRVPIVMQDEHLSTQEAEQILFTLKRPREQHKRTLNSVAAALILEWHLEEEEEKKRRREEKETVGQETGNREQGTEEKTEDRRQKTEDNALSTINYQLSTPDSSFILHPSSLTGAADV